jgi:hypothetical protein
MALFKSSDPWSGVVVVLTVGLFVVALFVKGFTHALFLETGVLLVSIKLILMAQKIAKTEESLQQHLTRIEQLLRAPSDAGRGQK